MLSDMLKKELVDRITASEKIDKVLLFGSEARGDAGAESDIDLLVVLDMDTVPNSYKERNNNYLRISRSIREIERHHPIDLLVYTKPEFEMITSGGSVFIRSILREAIQLA
jgi:predicted nucleotidyltransferase